MEEITWLQAYADYTELYRQMFGAGHEHDRLLLELVHGAPGLPPYNDVCAALALSEYRFEEAVAHLPVSARSAPTVLTLAVTVDCEAAVERLLDVVEPVERDLVTAVENAHAGIVRLLLDAGTWSDSLLDEVELDADQDTAGVLRERRQAFSLCIIT